jgi:hypothetical protein
MGDLFDDFLDELRRRQAEARGERPPGPRRVGPDDGPDDDDPDGPDSPDGPDGPDGPDSPDGPAGPDGRGDGPRRPGRRRPRRRQSEPNLRRIVVVWALIVGAVTLLLVGRGAIDLWTDVLWYSSVGYDAVFWTRLGAQVALFAAGLSLGLLALVLNLWLAGRLARTPVDGSGGTLRRWVERLEEAARAAEQGVSGSGGAPWEVSGARRPQPVRTPPTDLPDLVPIGQWVLAAFAIFFALGIAGSLSTAWETILLWQNRVPFSPDGGLVVDPIFGRDISFFLFELPFLRFVQTVVVGLALTSLLLVGGRYLLSAVGRGLEITTAVRIHLGLLVGIYLAGTAAGYQLDKLELVYSDRGIGTGVSYTDANAQFIAFDLLTVLTALAAALVIGAAFTRWVKPVYGALGAWVLASVIVGGFYPEAIQRFVVDPNELAQERPYIVNNIQMTRLAFGFDVATGEGAWDDSRRYEGDVPLTDEAIDANQATFRNARLWDYRPLGQTLDQLQTIRRYYDFFDVDTDRYRIGDEMRQVMLSARELDLAGNPQATGFVNRRIVFTHGIGVAMVPVNEVSSEGQPRLFIRNLPPVSSSGAPPVTEPRIYFGERPSEYIVVGAQQAEFDFPRGDADPSSPDAGEQTFWRGRTGIPLDTILNRLLFAVRFGDLDLLISDQVIDRSQLLFHRSLGERVPLVAPFLQYDKDPYVVVDDEGRLVYVWDAYTTSDLFPHAEPFNPGALGAESGLAGRPINYLRNSVKVTVDAYFGTTTFYVADPTDPLIRAWQGVFPDLFRPLDEMPADLQAHLRVPEERFNVQTRMYGRYHVTDPQTFYQNEDEWTIPTGQTSAQSLTAEAYYVIMRMPGEPESEFLLLQPMVPSDRPNMIAWIAARNDAPNYGDVRVYRFPVDTTVFGPNQIEARIDQDPIISAQVTLWNQSGSEVVRGNLIVVPVGESLVYLQPVYLRSTASSFPEFQRIIVASSSTVVWGESLTEALDLLLETQNGGPTPTPTPEPTPSAGPTATPPTGPTPTPTAPPSDDLPDDVPGLIDFANQHFELAQQALRDGDFARYGEEIELVRQALAKLNELGVPLAGSAPVPAP